MEKINYRFLNYKYYNKFISDLNDKKIREDSIVFIQDNLRIWARGKEYVCNGPYTSNISDIDGLVVKDGTGNVLLKISPNENGIIL